MDASYAWHPGTRGVDSVWVRSVPIYPDELFSSWLVRASLAQGCDPLVLTGCVWPKWRAWTVDIDRAVTSERMTALARLSGIPTNILEAATLQMVGNEICGVPPSRKSAWPWLLTLGARNTKRNGGLQYCPECFSTDREPYFRLQWRFAWHTGCERHGQSLKDRCWNCGAPLEPHRLIAEDKHVATCATCRADLIAATSESWLPSAQAFQIAADKVISAHAGVALGRPLTVSEWFDLAGYLISLVRQATCRAPVALKSMVESVTTSRLPELFLPAGTGIEGIPISDRQVLLGAVAGMIANDAVALRDACISAGVSRQGLCGARKNLPPMISELAMALPDNPRNDRAKPTQRKPTGPRPRHVVERMMARLVRLARQGSP